MTASPVVSQSFAVADPDRPTNVIKPNLDSGVAITASDATIFSPPLLALYVGSTGDVAVRMFSTQNTITFVGVPSGAFLPVCVDKVLAATTATDLVGLY